MQIKAKILDKMDKSLKTKITQTHYKSGLGAITVKFYQTLREERIPTGPSLPENRKRGGVTHFIKLPTL